MLPLTLGKLFFSERESNRMNPGLIYKSRVSSLTMKPIGNCAEVILFYSLQWRHVVWRTGNIRWQLAHSRMLDPALSGMSFQLKLIKQAFLNCESVSCYLPGAGEIFHLGKEHI